MIEVDDYRRLDARDVHNYIGVKARFNDWCTRSLDFICAIEGEDYWNYKKENKKGRPSIEYRISLETAKKICLSTRNNKAKELYKHLCSLDGVEVVFHHKTRKELLFEMNLKELLEGITKIETQFQVLSYRVDFFIIKYSLAIEYDENYHRNESQKELDEIREAEITEETSCTFIRVKENEELAGLNKIIKHIIAYEEKRYERKLFARGFSDALNRVYNQ
jgi:very-short-patch-repair endonuclease/phage anti-repressor protein